MVTLFVCCGMFYRGFLTIAKIPPVINTAATGSPDGVMGIKRMMTATDETTLTAPTIFALPKTKATTMLII